MVYDFMVNWKTLGNVSKYITLVGFSLTAGILGDQYLSRFRTKEEKVAIEEVAKPKDYDFIREVKTDFGDYIGNKEFEYFQRAPLVFGSGEIEANVLVSKVGGKEFRFYDIGDDRKDIDWKAAQAPNLDAELERVVILKDNRKYVFDRNMINGENAFGKRAEAILGRADEVYNAQLKKVFEAKKKIEQEKKEKENKIKQEENEKNQPKVPEVNVDVFDDFKNNSGSYKLITPPITK